MRPNRLYTGRSSRFWAHVKYISEEVGYAERGKLGACTHCGAIRNATKVKGIRALYECNQCSLRFAVSGPLRTYTAAQTVAALRELSLSADHNLIAEVLEYLNWRAEELNNKIATKFMNREQAAKEYDAVLRKTKPKKPPAKNKQTEEKNHPAYLSGIVSMIAESVVGPDGYVNDPQRLSLLTSNGQLDEIFSRRFDGAFPSIENPRAIWEVKEYYGTTTFGSRVADGVYETLLDGYEIEGVRTRHSRDIAHFLFIDDHFTWWICGKSYLCRMIDMLHTGHVDEIFFGREVLTDWEPRLRAIIK